MIANYTTTVSAERSLSEIMHMLATHGASKVLIDNGPQGRPTAIAFTVHERAFKLPIYADAVKNLRQAEMSKLDLFSLPMEAA